MTVNITKITSVGESISRSTALLGGDVRRSIQVDRIYRSQTIKQKTQLLRIRESTYRKLSEGLKDNQREGGIGGIVEWLIGGEVLRRGGGGLLRKFRGGGTGGGGRITFGKGSGPRLGGGGLGLLKKGGGGRLLAKTGLKRIPFLDIAFGAMAYGDRRSQGQTQVQAVGGAIAQTGGSIGGGLIGQALIPVPVLGYIIGSFIGSAVTTTIFDKVSGVDKLKSGADTRRIAEEKRLADKPSLFGKSLDKFDNTLERFADTVPTILRSKNLVSDLADDFPLDLQPPKPPKPGNPFGAGEIALDILSVGLLILTLADNLLGLWGTEVPAAANLMLRLRKYRRVLEFLGLMKKNNNKFYSRPESSSGKKIIKKKYVKRDNDLDLDADEAELLRRIREGELKFDELSEAITNQQLEQLLGLRKGITNQPNLKTNNQNQKLEFKTGGEFEVDAPLSGAIVPLELHGKETVTVVPEGKNKGGNTTIIMMGTKPRSPQVVTTSTPDLPKGRDVMLLQTPPFQTATKYFQMIGQLTT